MKRVYELKIEDEFNNGIDAISVVGSPAMESQFIALKKQEQKQKFAEVDKKKKIIMGVIMKPNKMIYRFDEATNEEYEVFFSTETVRRASELYFKNNKQRNFNVEHNSDEPLEAYLVESWIVEDTKKDKSAVYNLDAEVGDWVGTMKFDNDEDYKKALENGTGFSLEGTFAEKVILNKVDKMDFNQMKSELLNDLKSLFTKSVKMAQAKLLDGSATLEFEGDVPTVDTTISIVTPDGSVPAPAGEYELDNGYKVTVVEAGKIAEVSNEMEEEAPAEEAPAPAEVEAEKPAVQAMDSTGELKDLISSILVKFGEDLKAELTNQIDAKFSEATAKVTELKTELSKQPATKSTVVAPVEKEVKLANNKKSRILQSLNNLKN